MDSFFALPLTLVFGWPLSANLYTLLLFFAVGMVGFYLGNRLHYSFWGSVFLGCTLQSSTYLLQHDNAGRFSQLNIVFLLLGVALFLDVFHADFKNLKIKDRAFWRLPTALLLCGIGYWYYLWFFGLFAVSIVLLQNTRTSFVSRKNDYCLLLLTCPFGISFVLLDRDQVLVRGSSPMPYVTLWICLSPFCLCRSTSQTTL